MILARCWEEAEFDDAAPLEVDIQDICELCCCFLEKAGEGYFILSDDFLRSFRHECKYEIENYESLVNFRLTK